MANNDQPSGFQPYGETKKSSEYTAGARCFPGDCVTLQSDGKVDPSTAGQDIFGVALTYADADGNKVRVSTDPDQLYIGQADEADIDLQTDIGNNCDVLATAGNTTYKASRMEIDSSTIAAATAQVTVLGIEPKDDNAFGAQVKVICRINEHQIIGENDSAGV